MGSLVALRDDEEQQLPIVHCNDQSAIDIGSVDDRAPVGRLENSYADIIVHQLDAPSIMDEEARSLAWHHAVRHRLSEGGLDATNPSSVVD